MRGWKSFKADWVNPKKQVGMQFSEVTQQNIETFKQVELK